MKAPSPSCSLCGGEASLSLATGGMRELLCAPCAERRAGVPGLPELAAAFVGDRSGGDACPYCGTRAETARRTQLAGCPLCYVALADVWPDLGAVPGRYAEGKDNG